MKLHNSDLEMSVLYSICEGDNKVKTTLLAYVTPDYFYNDYANEAIKRIFSIVKKAEEAPSFSELTTDPVLSESTRKKLKKYKGEVITDRKYKRRLKQLQEYHQVRELYFMSERLNKLMQGEKIDVEQALEDAADDLARIRTKKHRKQEIHHIGKSNNSSAIIKRLLDKTPPKLVPTGFSAWDDVNGGVPYKALVGIGGPAGGGKTSLALQLAQNMTELGLEDVAYVPLEMDEDETLERIMANKAGVKLSKIKQKKTSSKEDRLIAKAYKNHVKKMKKNNTRLTVFSPEDDVNIEEVLLLLKPYAFRVIIIDYLTLLKGTDGDDASEKQWQKIGQIGRRCKIWAKANDAIVVLVAQVDDEGKLRYSRALKEHANILWTWPVNKETRENKVMKISTEKARNLVMVDFDLGYDDELFQVFDVSKHNEKDAGDEVNNADEYLENLDDE